MNKSEILGKGFPQYGEELLRVLSGNDIRIDHASGIANHDVFRSHDTLQAGD